MPVQIVDAQLVQTFTKAFYPLATTRLTPDRFGKAFLYLVSLFNRATMPVNSPPRELATIVSQIFKGKKPQE